MLAARIVIATGRVRRAVRRSLRENGECRDLAAFADEAGRCLGIRRRVRVIECDAVRTPAVHGVLRPVLLLPRGFAGAFDARETRHVILHELWHLRRLDVPLNWIVSAVQVLHWFNPFVWFAISRMNEERELACDELALSCLEEDERFDYARTILKLLETFRIAAPVPALVGIVNDKQKMKRRLLMIASFWNRGAEGRAPHRRQRRWRRRTAAHGSGRGLPASGKLHREMTINISENGMETRGKMTIDIAAPPASK